MNLESKLNNSLNNVLRSAGYIFEIINHNKKHSNLITGTNNQLITPQIIDQLSGSLQNFDDILDDTIGKFNDARWCIEQIVENKHKQEELKLKEEQERLRKEQEEKKRLEEEAETKRRQEEERKVEEERKKKEDEARKAEEERQKKSEEEQKKEREIHLQQQQQQQQQQLEQGVGFGFDAGLMMMSPSFDFNMDDITGMGSTAVSNAGSVKNNASNGKGTGNDTEGEKRDIPNPSDILSSISYTGGNQEARKVEEEKSSSGQNNNEGDDKTGSNGAQNEPNMNANDLDLEMNNLLGSDTLLLDGLNMGMIDQGLGGDVNLGEDDEFDVDSFLNQFGGGD